jgi:hypothetical protein
MTSSNYDQLKQRVDYLDQQVKRLEMIEKDVSRLKATMMMYRRKTMPTVLHVSI